MGFNSAFKVLMTLEFSRQIIQKIQKSNFMKIRPAAAVVPWGRTADTTKLTAALRTRLKMGPVRSVAHITHHTPNRTQ